MTTANETKRRKMDEISTESVNAVFGNTLVLDNILKFLPLSDVKALSRVNRHFHCAVRGSKRWSRNVVLQVTKGRGKGSISLLQNYLSNLQEPLRGMKINVRLPQEMLNLLLPFLRSVKFVAVMAITNRRSTYDIHDNESRLCKLLLSVLRSTPELTHLQMDIRFLLGRLSGVLSSPAVVNNLKNIKRLELLECDYYNPGTFRGRHGPMYKLPFHPDSWNAARTRQIPFPNNLREFSYIPMRLESFKMAKVSVGHAYSPIDRHNYVNHLFAILRNSKETLQELSLHLIGYMSRELRQLKMPALKRFTVSMDLLLTQHQEMETLVEFLRNHQTLEELDVEGVEEIGNNLMSAIQDCSQLKKLHIKTPKFSWNVDWTAFLGSLVYLKDFAIIRPEPGRWQRQPEQDLVSYGTGPNFLAALPKTQLESLTLKGISKMGPPSAPQDSVGFWNTSEVEDVLKTQLLQGFTCLRILSLLNCLDSLDDSLMGLILKEFKLLEELEFSDCQKLSDAGINGMGSTSVEATVSIANLRCLKSLIIRECHLVTPKGLVSCLTHPSLKSLEYMTSAPVKQWFIVKIAEQNPNLESLFVNHRIRECRLRDLRTQLKVISRLKRFGGPIKDYADKESESESDSD